MDGPYDGNRSSDTPVGNGSIRSFAITVLGLSGRRKGPAGEVVRPGREAYKASPTMVRKFSDTPVGAVHRAALTFVFQISGIRAARCTAPTMGGRSSDIPVGNGSIRSFTITVLGLSGRRKGLTGDVAQCDRRECILNPTKGAVLNGERMRAPIRSRCCRRQARLRRSFASDRFERSSEAKNVRPHVRSGVFLPEGAYNLCDLLRIFTHSLYCRLHS